jgi:hypothetical protein
MPPRPPGRAAPRRLRDILDDLRGYWLERGYFQLYGADVSITGRHHPPRPRTLESHDHIALDRIPDPDDAARYTERARAAVTASPGCGGQRGEVAGDAVTEFRHSQNRTR